MAATSRGEVVNGTARWGGAAPPISRAACSTYAGATWSTRKLAGPLSRRMTWTSPGSIRSAPPAPCRISRPR